MACKVDNLVNSKFGEIWPKKRGAALNFGECLSLKVLLGTDNWKKISFSFVLFTLIIRSKVFLI